MNDAYVSIVIFNLLSARHPGVALQTHPRRQRPAPLFIIRSAISPSSSSSSSALLAGRLKDGTRARGSVGQDRGRGARGRVRRRRDVHLRGAAPGAAGDRRAGVPGAVLPPHVLLRRAHAGPHGGRQRAQRARRVLSTARAPGRADGGGGGGGDHLCVSAPLAAALARERLLDDRDHAVHRRQDARDQLPTGKPQGVPLARQDMAAENARKVGKAAQCAHRREPPRVHRDDRGNGVLWRTRTAAAVLLPATATGESRARKHTVMKSEEEQRKKEKTKAKKKCMRA